MNEFEVNLFSKLSKELILIETSMIFKGSDVEINNFKIIDALNVVIGSFYAEDLLTSKGKEGLKEAIIGYTSNKYNIDIDHIYIQKLYIVKNVTSKTIIDALRAEGYIKK
ncbi:MAG: hypothetical protein JJV95_05820 [Sulfurospirillum sp.]|nr:hypothetical protein [Sulfurospirillum sp.]MBL0703482.1 hypothetical protein [Sulfurospirillum sp.]